MKPWIKNVPGHVVSNGLFDPGDNTILIQISELHFIEPKYSFKERYQFHFSDVEEDWFEEEMKITDEQAEDIIKILRHALHHNLNVLVHCTAGICRSGAVAEVGVMMGFEDHGKNRIPNMLVKKKLMKVLGWTYD